ncbi:peroxiredoxin [Meiothermus ruber]|jgi:peroxiredoxin Q/BCP|uniref:thioredoxin-dependent peroxiredoxin n=1 Tax=Meiothermus ruber (strain ATCC 35948 / DSM 1279 / VKM B-1258 / 21) TaxID=504728 RepID=D3PR39_MEIRD|nr:peroxiredoxin [Meiothermus ruber]ADD27922.1 alkyl hydroperoxide reductase/ Thiol specific antioxidant/ Mal allergen [Meiothermus ruber DSM 1279]AGK04391.1 alkyl hydroperoxide reductase [Meiothermus ruber DSM 1279]MCL6531224.1 peroxiredoxin [Meiothermus ruber]MCX7802557.1 peroxiredoxin [Meiothermus ruber]GAO74860.1 alkyl hydroperoxide reductase [Meiothermus ruber H328]
MKLKPGDPAPLLQVQDALGRTVDLAELVQQGRYIVLWFYPKSNSPGCTAQGRQYAMLREEFQQLGAEVFGVSADPASEQCAFMDKLALEGGLIPDPSGRLGKAFGVGGLWGVGALLGLYSRDTILINPQGKVEQVWRNVNPFRDAQVVLDYLKQASGRGDPLEVKPGLQPTEDATGKL